MVISGKAGESLLREVMDLQEIKTGK